MIKPSYRKAVVMVVMLVLTTALYANAQMPSVDKHPIEVEKAVCSQCHPDKWAGLDHAYGWDKAHRFSAMREGGLCNICHEEAFCTDCHANKEELKPSDKYKSSPERSMPHRGDYLTRHKIDGKLNPAACFKCHGRQNNGRCKLCHK